MYPTCVSSKLCEFIVINQASYKNAFVVTLDAFVKKMTNMRYVMTPSPRTFGFPISGRHHHQGGQHPHQGGRHPHQGGRHHQQGGRHHHQGGW